MNKGVTNIRGSVEIYDISDRTKNEEAENNQIFIL
jgi:hypothetical protein